MTRVGSGGATLWAELVGLTASCGGVLRAPAASERGLLDRRSTSQLMVISDAEFEAGLA